MQPTFSEATCRHRLNDCHVGTLSDIYYVPAFISSRQEAALLEQNQATKAGWKEVSGRRLQSYGGQVSKGGTLLQVKVPSWLQPVMDSVEQTAASLGLLAPNHVLVNAYSAGQGILAHEDGPVYHPCTCILSLGSSAVMHFHRKKIEGGHESRPSASVALMPGSLLIFAGEAYRDCLHSIDPVEQDEINTGIVNLQQCELRAGTHLDRSPLRISLTIRRVLNVRKNILRL